MAEQHAQLILRLSDPALKIRQVGLGDGKLRLCGGHIELRYRAAIVLRLSQVDELLPRGDGAVE